MEFLKVLKRKKLLFLNIFFLLYISINLFTGERGLISNFEKKKMLDDLNIEKSLLIKELQKRPRTITHGDARGNNIFKSSDGRTIGIIDWQMWAAGPASNEFSQLWFNSYSLESGMIHKLNELTHIYYDSLTGSNSEIKNSYPFEQLLDDTKLIFINMWIQYIGFTLGSIEGYKDPELKKSKDTQVNVRIRNCEIILFSKLINWIKTVLKKTKALGLNPATKKPSLYIAKLLFKTLSLFPSPFTFNVKVS